MKHLAAVMAASVLCALIATNAQAQNAGATTNVGANVNGGVWSSGTASATIVGANTGIATATAITSPIGQSAVGGVADNSKVTTTVHTAPGGAAGGHVTANGHAFAAAWVSP